MLLDPHTPEALILLWNASQKWSVCIYIMLLKLKTFIFNVLFLNGFPSISYAQLPHTEEKKLSK